MAINRLKQLLNEWGPARFPGYGRSIWTRGKINQLFYAAQNFGYNSFVNGDAKAAVLLKKHIRNWLIEAIMRDTSAYDKQALEKIAERPDGNGAGKIEQRHYFYLAEHICRNTLPASAQRKILKYIIGIIINRAGTGGFRESAWEKYIPISGPTTD